MKKICFAIGAAIIVILLLLQTRFNIFMQMDRGGLAIEDKSVSALLMNDPKEEPEEVEAGLYPFDALDFVYTRGSSYYMGENKKTKIDINFPLIINGGAGIWFFDDRAKLFNNEYEKFSTYKGLSVSERISFNPDGSRAADDEYLFAGLPNGFFVTLDNFVVDQGVAKEVPMNSVVFFTEKYFTYCEISDEEMHYRALDGMTPDTLLTVGDKEITYKELLINLGITYDKKTFEEAEEPFEEEIIEEPEKEAIEEPEIEETKPEKEEVKKPEREKKERPKRYDAILSPAATAAASGAKSRKSPQGGTGGVRPDSLRPDKTPKDTEAPLVEDYIKPVVTITGTTPGVYRVRVGVDVNDPASRIDRLRKVQFEFYEQQGNGKETLAYRTYTSTSGTVTAGGGNIKPNTDYRVNVYFTYYDEHNERVVESVASDIFVRTGDLSQVGSIYFKEGTENGITYKDIPFYYDNYVEITNVTYDKTVTDEEAVYGLDPKNLILTATKDGIAGEKFVTVIDISAVTDFKKGALADFKSLPVLDSNSSYSYVITGKDYFGNDLQIYRNTGTFDTCKSRPQGSIELVTNKIGETKFKVNIIDPDTASVAPENGPASERAVYLVISTIKKERYPDDATMWDAAEGFIDNNYSRVGANTDNESTVHFVYKFNTNDYTLNNGALEASDVEITANCLDLNQRYYVYLLTDYDLDNRRGVLRHDEIASIDFKAATLSSLGNIYIDVNIAHVTAHSANITYTINDAKTNETLQGLLSDVVFLINTTEGANPGVHSGMVFDNEAMHNFTGYNPDTGNKDLTPGSVLMDANYFEKGEGLSDAQKEALKNFRDIKNNPVVGDEVPYYLTSMTEYSITPVVYALYNGKRYEMNVSLTRSAFKTMREPAKVTVTDDLLAAGTLRFNVKIEDPDGAITGNSGHVVVLNLYDSHRNLVRAVRVPKNTDAPVPYEFTGLDPSETFFMNFVAVEYNEGYTNETFESNKLIYQHFIDNPINLSGNIKLISLDNFSATRLTAKTRVLIYDDDRIMNGQMPYFITVEKNGVDITSTFDTSLTKVENYAYDDGTNTIRTNSEWKVNKADDTYKMTLYVIINKNKLILDTLEFNARDCIFEIANAKEFVEKISKNPSARFVVTGDIIMDEVDYDSNGALKATLPSAGVTGTFRGEIDFQGYKLQKNNYKNEGAIFSNIGPKAEIKNAVFEFSDHTTTREYDHGIFCRHNYGHIHDIFVHYLGGSGTNNIYYGLVAGRNAASGVIERFVIKNDPQGDSCVFSARSNAGLLVYLNDGVVRNGYVYGSDINSVTQPTSAGSGINVGGIIGYQNSRGKTDHVFSLVNVVVSNPDMNASKARDTQYGAIIGYAIGNCESMYSVGQSFYNMPYNGKMYDTEIVGPALGVNSATHSGIYYWNEGNNVYAKSTKQHMIGLESLYDYNWQGEVLGAGFDAQPVEVGFYPHVSLSNELPDQELIPLPNRNITRLVEVISTEVVSYGENGDSALIKLRLNNPRNAVIKAVSIENLDTDLYEDDTFKTTMLDGYTTMYLKVSNPAKFVSMYAIENLTVSVGNSTSVVQSDALLAVDFYRLIETADDWYNYVVKKPDENARLACDIDFSGVPRDRICVTNTYTGKLDGGMGKGGVEKENNATKKGFSLKNITFTGSGYNPVVFTRVDGSVKNLCIEDFTANVPNRDYNGFITALYGEVSNVHTVRPHITGRTYLTTLVCYAYGGALIENCSSTDAEITYAEPANSNTEGKIGAIAARADGCRVTNCFARNVQIEANDLRTCLGAGAIVGYSGTSALENLYATGEISVRGNNVGGIVGYHTAGCVTNMMTNIISRVNVKSYQDNVGGIAGEINITEGTIAERNNMSGVALGNVMCVNTDSDDVSYTTGSMAGTRSTFYGCEVQLYNGITGAKFDEDGILISDESYQGTVKDCDKNTFGLITYDQATNPATYTDSSLLDMDAGAYDYSKAAAEHLPTLYYYGTSVPMPFQEKDIPLSLTKVENNLIKVTSVFVNETERRIALDLEGPEGYVITGYEIKDLNSKFYNNYKATFNASGTARQPIEYDTKQEHFLDSYMLMSISYKSADGKITGHSNFENNPVRIPLMLFADIADITTWNKYIKEETNYGNYENFRIVNDIDFSSGAAYTKNAKIGRLRGFRTVGTGDSMLTLSNIRLTNANENLIFRLNSEISNLRFSNCSVNTKSRDCIGLIGTSSGAVYDMEFNNITINSTSANNFIGLIGYQNGGCIGKYDEADPDSGKIVLNNVTIGTNATTASPYAGGITGYAKSNTIFTNIDATNVNVFGNGNVGGISGGAGKASFYKIRGTDFTVTSNANARVGGIVGGYEPGRMSGKTGSFFADVTLKGTVSKDADGYTDTSTTTISFKNPTTSSTHIGGLIGYTNVYFLGKINSAGAYNTRVVQTSPYDTAETNVSNMVDGIVVKGYVNNIGGMYGYCTDDYDSHCYNTLVTAVKDTTAVYNYVGGIAGQISYISYYDMVKGTKIKINNHGFVGLGYGYKSSDGSIYYCKVEDSTIELNQTGSITTELKNVGGVIGYAYYPVYYSSAVNTTIDAPKHNNVGGVAGYLNNSLSRCFYYAEPESDASPKANDKYFVSGNNYVGGVAGYHFTGSVQYSYSNANVKAANFYAGGVDGAYRNGYTVTKVSGKDNYGYSTASLFGNYFAGTVSAKDFAGGLVGDITMASSEAVTSHGGSGAAANGGRRVNATDSLPKTGSANEITYTYRNLGLASKITATGGTHAHAFAGNVDGFEGRANRSNQTSGSYGDAKDRSTVDKADITFFWDSTELETTAGSVKLAFLKNSEAPEWARNGSAKFVQYNVIEGTTDVARYVVYSNDRTGVYDTKEKDTTNTLNVRLITGTDLATHGPYYTMYHVSSSTGNTNPGWAGRYYYVILTADTKTYSGVYANGNYGAVSGKSYLPHIRVNNNTTANDSLTQYQVRKNINLPAPTSSLGKIRLRAAMRIMRPVISDPVVYASSASTINIEFAENALQAESTYVKVYYGNQSEPAVQTLLNYGEINSRVLTLNYDFAKKIRIEYGYADVGGYIASMSEDGKTLGVDYEIEDILEDYSFLDDYTMAYKDEDSLEEEEGDGGESLEGGNPYIYKPRSLARRVMTYDTAYYYVTDGGVVKGYGSSAEERGEDGKDPTATLISGKFVNIYEGFGLTSSGRVINLSDGSVIGDTVKGIELTRSPKALEEFNLNGMPVSTYWKYAMIGGADDSITREAQILKSKNGNVNIIHSSIENIKDSAVMYTKDGDEYLTVLGNDGIMFDLYMGENINAPEDFKRSGILYMSNNFNTSAPFILVEYANGGIVGYNYMTGEYLFDNSIKNEMSLIDYIKVYFSGDKSLLKPAASSYGATGRVAELAGTPERLATMVVGNNNGELLEGNNEGGETAFDKSTEKVLFDEDNTEKAGDNKALRNVEEDSGFDIGIDTDEVKGSDSENKKSNVADGMLIVGNMDEGEAAGNGIEGGASTEGERNGGEALAMGGTASETGEESLDGGSKAAGMGGEENSKKAHTNGEGGGSGTGEVNELDEPDLEGSQETVDGTNETSGEATGGGTGRAPAVEGKASSNETAATESLETDGVNVGKHSSSVKDLMEVAEDEETESEAPTDSVTTEKKLMTVYNQSTGTYEIIDMDKFMTDSGYESENARLSIKDFSVYGGYITDSKPTDEENKKGIALYVLASLALLAGIGGAIYYRKKHKVKI